MVMVQDPSSFSPACSCRDLDTFRTRGLLLLQYRTLCTAFGSGDEYNNTKSHLYQINKLPSFIPNFSLVGDTALGLLFWRRLGGARAATIVENNDIVGFLAFSYRCQRVGGTAAAIGVLPSSTKIVVCRLD